ncbi:MAG: FAD-dependent oxidoreductase, partial [bacterium]
ASGKKVAIVGSGPAGLTAAYYLQQYGHACTIFDDHTEPGGMMRYGIPEDVLPRHILDGEIDIIRRLGAQFEMNRKVGEQLSIAELRQDFDAVVLVMGQVEVAELQKFEVETTKKSIRIDSATFATSVAGIYAGGGVVNPGKMAVRSVGHGRFIAIAVDQYLTNRSLPVLNDRSQSRIGKVGSEELQILAGCMQNLKVGTYNREFSRDEIAGNGVGISTAQAIGESGQCIQCGCASFHHCKLRLYAEEYNANTKRFKGEMRRTLKRILDHPYVVYEPGKCIQCGLCVRITEKEKDMLGLTFIGRGFDVRVDVSLNGTMEDGLAKTAADCVEACPSGALEFKSRFCYK